MPGTTAKGVPYPLGTDAAATLDTTGESLADWVDARPGVATVTTAQRNALTGAGLWQGRTVWNSSVGRLEVYDGVNWVNSVAGIGLVYHGTGTQAFTPLQTANVTIDTEVYDIGSVGSVGSAVLTIPSTGLYATVFQVSAVPDAGSSPEVDFYLAGTAPTALLAYGTFGTPARQETDFGYVTAAATYTLGCFNATLNAAVATGATVTFDVKLYRIA